MNVEYRTQKNLPCDALYQLFLAVGWAKEDTTQEMIDNFDIGFRNSTFVFSAWIDGRLVGCVRVLSDLHFRSVIYDLAVLPEFQNKGIFCWNFTVLNRKGNTLFSAGAGDFALQEIDAIWNKR